MGERRVTIILPCRNEVKHIRACIDSIFHQESPGCEIEVLVVDGMSSDGTKEIVEEYARQEPRLRIIDNPERIVSSGLNAGIHAARGEIIVRMDAHTTYAPDYVRQCINVLETTGADNVGGPWLARGNTWLQRAIALAFGSPFSSGGAGSHRVSYEGEVDSVYLGCWRKDTLERLGPFDRELVRNQDDEMNLRLVLSGGRVWQAQSIRSWYWPRSSLSELWRQYLQYGYWKVRVIQKHRMPASIRHLVPGSFVGLLLLFAILAPLLAWSRVVLVGLLALYLCVNAGAVIITCRRYEHWKYIPVMPLVFAAYHFGYGLGFLWGIKDFVLMKKQGQDSFRTLTR